MLDNLVLSVRLVLDESGLIEAFFCLGLAVACETYRLMIIENYLLGRLI
jgi:hypothetical protein